MRTVCLLLAFALAACSISVCFGDGPGTKRDVERDTIAQSLPRAYSQDFEIVYGGTEAKRFAIICATPTPAPISTNKPPYVKLFLFDLAGGNAKMLWDTEMAPDNVCIDMSIHPTGGQTQVVSVVARPYSGSVYKYHLHLYRYHLGDDFLAPAGGADYIDGVALALSSTTQAPPAFLVYDPVYDGRTKSDAQPYRFRLFVLGKNDQYTVKRTITTHHKYKTASSAYSEVTNALRDITHSEYRLPVSIPEVYAIEHKQ